MNADQYSRAAEQLLEHNRVGVLMRVFATSESDAENQIHSAMVALEQLLHIQTGARKTFARVDFLVASDHNFMDSDYGGTADTLRERIRSYVPEAPVHVFEIKRGDINTMLLNYGIANQTEHRISYSLILSHWIHEHITTANVHRLLAALQSKSRVAGVAIPEVAETVRQGRIANTFAMWHNKSLATVGGFDLRAAVPTDQEQRNNRIRTRADGSTFIMAGVEEIIPLLRFAHFFGPCITVVEPEHSTQSPTEHYDAHWQQRHHRKLATKNARQEYMAHMTPYDLSSLEKNLLH